MDTPGHEIFANMRDRGTSMCDIAILVVDITHGLEQQTLEAIKLLKSHKTPFIIALNKLDKIYKWESTEYGEFTNTFKKQDSTVKEIFNTIIDGNTGIITQFMEQGLHPRKFKMEQNNYII